MSDDKKKFSELVLAERDKGNVVLLVLDEILSAPVKDIVKQPVDGLLWDLNRDEATALSFMDEEGMNHWVNNFAVALVIRELKRENEPLRELFQMTLGYWMGPEFGPVPTDEEMYNKIANVDALLKAEEQED